MKDMPTIEAFDDFERAALPVIKPFKSSFGATWFHEAGSKPARREWLVKDLILARSFGIVYGPPGCGKSFLLADLMLTAAASVLPERQTEDTEWFGYRTNPFGVVYVVAEGADDFVIRLHAWRLNQGIETNAVLPFVFLPSSIDMRSDDADTKRLTEEIKGIDIEMRRRCGVGVGAVVIDTVSRALAGGNENASDVMGAFVSNCESIQKQTGTAIIGVHHGGKEAGRGPRGHEALLGAADFVFEVMPRDDEHHTNRWAVRKLKAGPAGAERNFALKPMTVDQDDDGDPITSCVVVSQEETEIASGKKNKGYPATQGEVEFLRVLGEAIEQHGVMPPSDLELPGIVNLIVNTEDVRKLFRERYAMTEDGDEQKVASRLRQRWSRATKSLLRNRIIGSSEPWIWMTGKKARGARLVGVIDTTFGHSDRDDQSRYKDASEGF